jgi:plastocyanin
MHRNLILLCALALALSACSKSEPNAPKIKPVAATPIDPATIGTITGAVNFEGVAPKAASIDMSQDPACPLDAVNLAETFAVNGGKLGNVYVYVKDGLGNRTFASPAQPVILDQKGCKYIPHVVAIMSGQTLRVINSDRAQHNVHPSAQKNDSWNESQAPGGPAIERAFENPEIMLPVKCNQHPWMKMFVNVSEHPFHAVSDANGKFEIKGLPAGEYTLAAVHEKLGEQTTKITVTAKQETPTEFTFKSQ